MQGRGAKRGSPIGTVPGARGPSCRGVDRNTYDGVLYFETSGRPSCRGVARNEKLVVENRNTVPSPPMQGRGTKRRRRRPGRPARASGPEEHTSELQSLMSISYAVVS